MKEDVDEGENRKEDKKEGNVKEDVKVAKGDDDYCEYQCQDARIFQ